MAPDTFDEALEQRPLEAQVIALIEEAAEVMRSSDPEHMVRSILAERDDLKANLALSRRAYDILWRKLEDAVAR